MNLKASPKVELHLHLDCSLSYEVVSRLEPTITEDQYKRTFIAPTKCASLSEMLSCAPQGIRLMQSEERLRLVTLDLFQQLKKDNVIYAEIRFAPHLHLEKGLSPNQVVQIVADAVSIATQDTGIEGRIILCTLRHFSAEQSLETAKLVEQFRNNKVVALDLAGDEAGYPITPHLPAFEYAIQKGLGRTAHAGEASGAESVWETLKYFRPMRIGHGVRSIEDKSLVNQLRSQNIHLEICPTSNDQTNVCKTYQTHPLDRLYRNGLSTGINTDCRTLCGITLNEEYEKIQSCFAWKLEDFLNCNLNAVRASFAPDSLKQTLITQLYQGYVEN